MTMDRKNLLTNYGDNIENNSISECLYRSYHHDRFLDLSIGFHFPMSDGYIDNVDSASIKLIENEPNCYCITLRPFPVCSILKVCT